jgi:hypothetical protein
MTWWHQNEVLPTVNNLQRHLLIGRCHGLVTHDRQVPWTHGCLSNAHFMLDARSASQSTWQQHLAVYQLPWEWLKGCTRLHDCIAFWQLLQQGIKLCLSPWHDRYAFHLDMIAVPFTLTWTLCLSPWHDRCAVHLDMITVPFTLTWLLCLSTWHECYVFCLDMSVMSFALTWMLCLLPWHECYVFCLDMNVMSFALTWMLCRSPWRVTTVPAGALFID